MAVQKSLGASQLPGPWQNHWQLIAVRKCLGPGELRHKLLLPGSVTVLLRSSEMGWFLQSAAFSKHSSFLMNSALKRVKNHTTSPKLRYVQFFTAFEAVTFGRNKYLRNESSISHCMNLFSVWALWVLNKTSTSNSVQVESSCSKLNFHYINQFERKSACIDIFPVI